MVKVQQIYRETDGDLWLNDDQQIWRYVPYKTMFLYLKGQVFIPSIEKLREGDPFEGNFPVGIAGFNRSLHDSYPHHHQEVTDWILKKRCTANEQKLIQVNNDSGHPEYKFKLYQRHYLHFLRKTRYAWCWFLDGIESALMWNSYGRDGLAVGTNVGKLKSALEKSGQDFVFGRMAYRSARPNQFDLADPINRRLLTMPHFFKREEYKGEQEVRFVTTGPGNDLMLELPLTDWITEFRLHPKLQPSETEAIKSVVKTVLPEMSEIICEQSDLLHGTENTILKVGGLSRELDNSDFIRWRNGSDQIPECLKSDGPEQRQAG